MLPPLAKAIGNMLHHRVGMDRCQQVMGPAFKERQARVVDGQRVLGLLGQAEKRGRLEMKPGAEGADGAQREIFDDDPPEWVEVDAKRVRTQNNRAFGGAWLGRELMLQTGLIEFTNKVIPPGREDVPWPTMAMILVLSRVCHPSSELAIAESHYESSTMAELLPTR